MLSASKTTKEEEDTKDSDAFLKAFLELDSQIREEIANDASNAIQHHYVGTDKGYGVHEIDIQVNNNEYQGIALMIDSTQVDKDKHDAIPDYWEVKRAKTTYMVPIVKQYTNLIFMHTATAVNTNNEQNSEALKSFLELDGQARKNIGDIALDVIKSKYLGSGINAHGVQEILIKKNANDEYEAISLIINPRIIDSANEDPIPDLWAVKIATTTYMVPIIKSYMSHTFRHNQMSFKATDSGTDSDPENATEHEEAEVIIDINKLFEEDDTSSRNSPILSFFQNNSALSEILEETSSQIDEFNKEEQSLETNFESERNSSSRNKHKMA